MTLDVLIDNNALSEALSGMLWDAVAEKVRRIDARLVMANDVLSELFVGERVDLVVDRFSRLSLLCERVGPSRRAIAQPIHYFFEREIAANCDTTPTIDEEECAAILDAFADPDHMTAKHAELYDGVIKDLNKNRMFEIALDLAEGLSDKKWEAVIQELPEVLKMFRTGNYADRRDGTAIWILQAFLERMGVELSPDNVVLAPARFKSMLLYAHYGDLIATSAAVFKHKPPKLKSLNLDRNNWIDARIAATGAYCRYIISGDRDLAWAINFISPVLHAPPTVIRLQEFLNS